MADKITYWIELSDYDLETAQAMLETRRFLYVGFMCHQVIEKALKAYWSKVLEEPPLKIHHLSRLALKSGLMARYPSYKELMMKVLTPEYCKELLNKIKTLQLWIKGRL